MEASASEPWVGGRGRRDHTIDIVTDDEAAARELDELMWRYPAERFLPHVVEPASGAAPVRIRDSAPSGKADVVINLTKTAMPEPGRYHRLLEIVPHHEDDRGASRDKFRAYRALGLTPGTHDIN
jgi:DNA polymerase-3 subunit chi